MRDFVQVSVPVTLSPRDVTVLRRCEADRVELVNSSTMEPDVVIDGLNYCDSPGARRLITAGLLRGHHVVPVGQSVTAVLTAVGRLALEAALRLTDGPG